MKLALLIAIVASAHNWSEETCAWRRMASADVDVHGIKQARIYATCDAIGAYLGEIHAWRRHMLAIMARMIADRAAHRDKKQKGRGPTWARPFALR
jgi:hypothetical protein